MSKPVIRLGCPKCPHCDQYMSDSQDARYSFNVAETRCDKCNKLVIVTRVEVWMTRKPEDAQPYIADTLRDNGGSEFWRDGSAWPTETWKGIVAAPNAFGYADDRDRWSTATTE